MSGTTGQKPTKSLDTLVDDIYEKLKCLSIGSPLNIPEDELEQTIDGLRSRRIHRAQPTTRHRTFYIRITSERRQQRLLWF